MKKSSTSENYPYRVRSDGERFRRIYCYITQKNGLVDKIETVDSASAATESPEAITRRNASDLIGYFDMFRDGSLLLTINYENPVGDPLLNLAREFQSMVPVDSSIDDGRYSLRTGADRTRFLLLSNGFSFNK